MILKLLRFLEGFFYSIGDYFEDRADSIDPEFLAMIRVGIKEVEEGKTTPMEEFDWTNDKN